MTRLIPLSATAAFGLASCTTATVIGQRTGSEISRLSTLAVERINPPGVRIVEVREKDLKELPSGRERALAYEKARKGGGWFFGGLVDFKEPALPEPGTELDGGLLPPKTP